MKQTGKYTPNQRQLDQELEAMRLRNRFRLEFGRALEADDDPAAEAALAQLDYQEAADADRFPELRRGAAL